MAAENNIEKLIKQFYAGKTVNSRFENEQQLFDDALAVFERAGISDKLGRSRMLIKIAVVILVFVSIGFVYNFRGNKTSDLVQAAIAKIRNADTLVYCVKTDNTSLQTKWTLTKSGYVQIESGDLVIILNAASAKGAVIIPQQKKTFAIEWPSIQMEKSQIPFLIVEKLKLFSSRNIESLGKKEINNKTAEGFCLTENNCVTKIWVDPESLRLMHLEMQFTNQRETITANSFEINSIVEKPFTDGYEKMPIRLNAELWMANEFYLNEFITSLTKLKNENDVFQSSDTYHSLTGTAMRLGQRNNFIAFDNFDFELVY